MPSSDPQREPARTTSKKTKLLALPIAKSRPGLAVDTSVSRHRGQAPQQVFPCESKTQEQGFVSLSDVKALNLQYGTAKVKRPGALKQRLENKVFVRPGPQKSVDQNDTQQTRSLTSARADVGTPAYGQGKVATAAGRAPQSRSPLQVPPFHKRIDRLRPTPLDLTKDVSPSDRAIPIGIAIPSASLSNHTHSPQSTVPYNSFPLRRESSLRYGQEVSTPTIIITPAKEDFESAFTASPEDLNSQGRSRPASSVYSKYTNSMVQHDRTPPVPPLPLFAVDSKSTVRGCTTSASAEEATPAHSGAQRTKNSLSICTAFEEDVSQGSSTPISGSKRRSSQANLPTPRRSKGWWDVLTTPFSASSASKASIFRSPSLPEEREAEDESMLTGASDMGVTDDGLMLTSRSQEDDELRSAPPTNFSARSFNSGIPTPQRSDTAPGALDLGNADDVNIYRPPSQGAASSYYDRNRSFPSMIQPETMGSSRGMDGDLQGWSPSQSVYREPHDDTSAMPLSSHGEAASYYDSGRNFPSLIGPPEAAGSNRGMEPWSPSQSVFREQGGSMPTDVGYGAGESPEMPIHYGGQDDGRGFVDEESSPDGDFGAESMPRSANYGGQEFVETPMEYDAQGANRSFSGTQSGVFHGFPSAAGSSFGDDHTAGFEGAERSPFDTGSEADFAGFSATHPAAEPAFFSTPSERELGDTTPGLTVTGRGGTIGGFEQALSPQSATPVLEHARTATFMRPHSREGELREVDLAYTPMPNGSRLGSEAETISSREGDSEFNGPVSGSEVMDEKSSYLPSAAYHARNDSQGLGISDDSSERGLFASTQTLSKEPSLCSDKFGQLSIRKEQDREPGRPWHRRFFLLLAATGGFLLILLIVLLVMFIPLHHDDIPVQAEFLNLTGFPPLPTGVSTIVGPQEVNNENGCVSPDALWSCAVPSGEGQSTTQPTQPNFRFLIRFQNGSTSDEAALDPTNSTISRRNSGLVARASARVRRSVWTSYIYSSSPSPPSMDDQTFLGRTTEKVNEPYNGEETPFYISLLDASALEPSQSSNLRKRHDGFRYPYPTSHSSNSNNSTSGDSTPSDSTSKASTNAPEDIPRPALKGNSEPMSAELYPFAYAQPLRLFNRGQNDEYYGFYTYFDRSVYISSSSTKNRGNTLNLGETAASNVPLDSASAVCTWSETRLLVQIWTQKADVSALNTTAGTMNIPAVNSTANDMTAPGSFPLSVTITIDRHGGDASRKGVYCYGVDEEKHVVESLQTWVAENRGFDGKLVNAATVPTNNGTQWTKRDESEGSGIDGGSGGCACQWQNWR